MLLQQEAVLILQAGIRARLVRSVLQDIANATTVTPSTQTTPYGEYTVSHTFLSASSVNIQFLPRTGGGLLVSELKDPSLPTSLKPGMLLAAVNGSPIEDVLTLTLTLTLALTLALNEGCFRS